MDYSFFDSLMDSVFVINKDKVVIYCNESAAKLCDSSVKRMIGKKAIYQIIEFSDKNLFSMPAGVLGRDEPFPYSEVEYTLKKAKNTSDAPGRVQIAIQPFVSEKADPLWVVILRDVTLEQVLHAKYHKQLEEKENYINQLHDAQKKLEDYSANLKQMVDKATEEIQVANSMLKAIMNSLGQGFLTFDKNGICSNFYTKACETIIETNPLSKNIWDVLKISQNEFDTFQMWISALFSEQLPFETLKELGPAFFAHSKGLQVKLDYFPIRNDKEKIINIVVVATDQTNEYLAKKAFEKEKKYANMIVKMVTSKKQFASFLSNVKNTLSELNDVIFGCAGELDYEYLFRILHTLEGEAAAYSVEELRLAARAPQEILTKNKESKARSSNLIKSELLAGIKAFQAEYDSFLIKNKMIFDYLMLESADHIEIRAEAVLNLIDKLFSQGVSQAVCQEIGDTLLKEPLVKEIKVYQNVVESLADRFHKKLNPIQFVGENTKLYLSPYQDLFSSLIHSIRNALDHGIELPAQRQIYGKNEFGTITFKIASFQKKTKNWIRISIEDDGAGIDIDKLKAKLLKTNSADEISKMTEYNLIQHIFDSGLSTKDQVEETSGRGIGMSAIKSAAERLGGSAWVEMVVNMGTKVVVEVPEISFIAQKAQAA